MGRPFRGRVFRYGDHVNTDVIFPGRYTYTKSRPEEVVPHALEDLDPTFAGRVRPGDVIVAGWNWGCGSSREQAAVCLRYAGVGAVIARSFGRIFYRNALNNGLLAIVCPEAVDALEEGAEVEVDLEGSAIRCGDIAYEFSPFSPAMRSMINAGGLIEQTRRRLAEG
ncbi:MAG: 3-isopropylmalate dehydratase [Holophagales bacterium]|nr:3-isopropylmalate dehydratase [Holophagales bacterium]MYC10820.1 3-isopropylmalate dehydratase [Holophagales bacterium]